MSRDPALREPGVEVSATLDLQTAWLKYSATDARNSQFDQTSDDIVGIVINLRKLP